MADRRAETIAALASPKGLVGGPFGSTLGSRDYTEAGVPVIRGTNLDQGRFVGGDFVYVSEAKVRDELARNVAEPGDLVFTQRGTLGQVAVVGSGGTKRFVVSQSQMRLRVDPGRADAMFVYYACSTEGFRKQIADHAIATGVPHINLGILSRLTVPLPPLEEQRAIADVLSALDDKIAANSAADATSDMLIESLYRRALADPATTEVPFFEAFDADFGEPFVGRGFTTPGNGRPLIRIRDLKTFAPQVWTIEQREREVVINPGEVVVGMDAEFRPTWWLGEPGLLNQRVCRVSSRHAGSAFVGEALRSPLRAIEEYKSGTTVIHLNKSDLALTRVALPPSLALAEFDAEAEPLLRRRVASAHESRALAATRDALLPALMSGRLRVRDAAERIDSVGP